jgi:rhodanese-related sulfurtransferase
MRTVSPREAYDLMVRDGYVYLDVRTATEFAEGRPPGARNVPYALPSAVGLTPNPTFVAEVTASFTPETKLVVGCASGVRSRDAARLLHEAGFREVIEQRAGMLGVRDPFGRLREPGWRELGLPVEDEAGVQERA